MVYKRDIILLRIVSICDDNYKEIHQKEETIRNRYIPLLDSAGLCIFFVSIQLALVRLVDADGKYLVRQMR